MEDLFKIMKKKKIKINSNAFPPNSKEENKKIQSAVSGIHKFIREENIEIESTEIKFRTIIKEDVKQLKPLFKEWFPLDYDDEYFNNIFLYIENNCGFSLVAYFENPKFDSKDIYEDSHEFKHFTQIIIGVLLTNKELIERYQKNAEYNYENLGFLEEVNFTTKYFVYIQSLGVLDEYRRLKLGSIFLDKLLEEYRNDIDCLGFYLHVVSYNEVAINFYERIEFEEMNRLYNYYKIGDCYYDSFVMTRLLYKKDRKKTDYLRFFLDIFNFPLRFLIFILTFGFCFKRCRNKKRNFYKKKKKN